MKSQRKTDLRLFNRLTVFDLLKKNNGISKAEIARQTGLSAPTSMKIVNFIKSKDLIVNSGGGCNEIGRKSIHYKVNADRLYCIGIVIEGNYINIGIVNLAYEIVNKVTIKVCGSFEDMIRDILLYKIKDFLITVGIGFNKIIGIGIGVPGVYNLDNYELSKAPLVNVIENTNIRKLVKDIEKALNIPLYIANDTNMKAWGEYLTLDLIDDDLIYISLGTGLGAGIIIKGQLHFGSQFMSGEVGYMTYKSDYIASINKPGWLEEKINLSALKKLYGFDLHEVNKAKIDKVIEYVSEYIAICINNINVCLDCKNISLGGVVIEILGEDLIEAINIKLNRITNTKMVIRNTKSEDPGIIGLSRVLIDKKVKEILSSDN